MRPAPTLVRLSLHRWGSNDDDILSGSRPTYPLQQSDSPAIPAEITTGSSLFHHSMGHD